MANSEGQAPTPTYDTPPSSPTKSKTKSHIRNKQPLLPGQLNLTIPELSKETSGDRSENNSPSYKDKFEEESKEEILVVKGLPPVKQEDGDGGKGGGGGGDS